MMVHIRSGGEVHHHVVFPCIVHSLLDLNRSVMGAAAVCREGGGADIEYPLRSARLGGPQVR